MKAVYKSFGWVDTQAKTLERKTLNRAGKSLTWNGIADKLCKNAIIEVRDKYFVLDEDKYKENKQETINYLKEEYKDK